MIKDGESSRCIGASVPSSNPLTRRRRRGRLAATASALRTEEPCRRHAPSRWESSPTRPARSRSSGSPTPTSPGWSSATSTPRAACSGGTSSCISRTARPTTPSRPRRPRSSSQEDQRRRHLRRHLQLHAAGHQGPGRRRGQDALHLPRAVRGPGVRPAHLLHRPGAGAAGRPVHPVADAARPGAKTFYLPSADYIWPHVMNARVREVVTANGGDDRRRGVLPARPHGLPRDRRADHRERRRRRVQHDRAARGLAVLRAAARLRLREPRRAARLHVLRRELPRTWCRPRTSRGCTAASTTTRPSTTRSAGSCSRSTTRSIPATRSSPAAAAARASTAGCGSGPPR